MVTTEAPAALALQIITRTKRDRLRRAPQAPQSYTRRAGRGLQGGTTTQKSSSTFVAITAQNQQPEVTMETAIAGSRAGRDCHRGMKARGRVEDQ